MFREEIVKVLLRIITKRKRNPLPKQPPPKRPIEIASFILIFTSLYKVIKITYP